MDFEANAPQQEGIIHKVYERKGKEYPHESPELHAQVNNNNLGHRYLPILRKILRIIQQEILKGTYLPVTLKETQIET